MVAPRGNGRTSQGRKRIAISLIQNPERLLVTFSKRKSGLLKKASELSLLCGAHVAAVVFSPAGKPSAVGSPSVDRVLRRFAPLPGDEDGLCLPDVIDDREAVEATLRRAEEARARVAEEKARMDAVGEKVLRTVVPGGARFWWEADVEALGEEELGEFARALRWLRDNVRCHADKLLLSSALQTTTPPPPLQSSLCGR